MAKSKAIGDGGPAFPRPSCDVGDGTMFPAVNGMTMRDYFAGQALVGYAANAQVMGKAIGDWAHGTRPTCIAEFLAGLAYEVADKMLSERRMTPTESMSLAFGVRTEDQKTGRCKPLRATRGAVKRRKACIR